MYLFIADVHLGRSDPQAERAVENELISFLRSVRDEVEGLYLLGDIFEHFIEYRHSIPKGFSRLLGLLADWTDQGIRVVYVVGNHDSWHRDYFETELGVRVVRDDTVQLLSGLRVYMAHGDGLGKGAEVYSWLKPILRHPLIVGLYTGVLPSDLGLSIAKWYSKRFRKTSLNQERVDALRDAARVLLQQKDVDVVVMGHSHMPELSTWNEGVYVNPGCWYTDYTAAIIEDGKASIVKWDGSNMKPYSAELPTAS